MSKRIIVFFISIFSVLHFFGFQALGEPSTKSADIILKAMKDELNRNIGQLNIAGMEKPFFISYAIYDIETLEIVSSLGSIVKSDINRYRDGSVRLMVGDYSFNDENFSGGGGSYSSSMLSSGERLPIEDDYQGIRRYLWVNTDNIYKMALEEYENKKAAVAQQSSNSRKESIDDFSRAPVFKYRENIPEIAIDKDKYEKIVSEVSAVFKNYPDIFSSQVRLHIYKANVVFINSEGTEVVRPLILSGVEINAYTQASDGEPLSNNFSFFSILPENLPDLLILKESAAKTAKNIENMRNASEIEEPYYGPVMFEGQAVAELFSQRLFDGRKGLIAYRKPVVSSPSGISSSGEETLEDRVGKRIISNDISIKALPRLEKFGKDYLIGATKVDAEGVEPPDEISLVENGILKTFLCDRIPTPKVPQSNGHERYALSQGMYASTTTGPGVIQVVSSAAKPAEDLKKDFIKRIKAEGLDYGILVRAVKPVFTGAMFSDPMVQMNYSFDGGGENSLTKPLLIYKVYAENGREELIRPAKIGSLGIGALRHIAGVSDDNYVYNTLTSVNWASGVPATFIVPNSVLFEELEISKNLRDFIPNLPVVPSPFALK